MAELLFPLIRPPMRDAISGPLGAGGAGAGQWLIPNTPLTNNAVKGSASAYIDIGNMSLPAGDWCIFFTARIPATATTDWYLLSLGALSNNILVNNGNVHIWVPGDGANAAYNMAGWALSGKDDAGNNISPKMLTLGGTANVPAITGPQQRANTPDNVIRHVFAQKSGGKVSLWIIDPAGTAQQYGERAVSFGAVATAPARLGARGRAAIDGFTAIEYQLFGRVAKSLTQHQMEAYAAGVDPRAIPGLTFSAADGDLLFAFSAQAAEGQAYIDLIQGQVATAHGTFATNVQLLPTTVQTDRPRINVQRYQVFQSTGATSDITLDGTYYGADGEIEVRFTNEVNGTEQVAYAKIADGHNGRWSGTLPAHIARRIDGYRAEVRKRVAGVVVGGVNFATASPFHVGLNLIWTGQSLARQLKTNNTYTPTGAVANFCSFHAHGDGNLGVGSDEGIFAAGFSRPVQGGYGEARISQYVGNSVNCVVGHFNQAKSGSSITDWIDDVGGIRTAFFALWNRYKHKYVGFNQGQNSLGLGYAGYKAALDTWYGLCDAEADWDWYFLISSLANTYAAGQTPAAWFDVRRAQVDWVAEKIAAGNTRIILAATTNDSPTTGMNADGIHKLADPNGYGMDAERVAGTINFIEGTEANSGVGPRIVSAAWDGATNIRVTVAHNGGTALQLPNVAAITGFEASINGFSSLLTISGAAIFSATEIDLTLSTTPASAPAVRYQYGQPGAGTTTAANGLTNPVYDNRAPYQNTALGFPVMFTPTPIQST